MADPLFMHELALELHMPVSEIGSRMSNHELNVLWPAYFDAKRKQQEAEEAKRGGR